MNLIITKTHNSMDHVLLYKPQVENLKSPGYCRDGYGKKMIFFGGVGLYLLLRNRPGCTLQMDVDMVSW